MAAGEVRIIGGKWRGRKLRFQDEAGLRPTLARIRETVGNWLQAQWPGARCLDLFAGTGALGIEALSRGAAAATFVERSPRASERIKQHLALLAAADAADTQVFTGSASKFLRRETPAKDEPGWDIVFLDPPFASAALHQTLGQLADSEHLAPGAYVYVEAARPRRAKDELSLFATLPDWRIYRQSQAGDVEFGLVQHAASMSRD